MNKLAFALLALTAGTTQATLIDRGGGLIYDDVLNITWLQDANYAKTSGYDADGLLRWEEADAWAKQLVYGGYDDWRLPHVLPINGVSYGITYIPQFKADGTSDVGYNISEQGTDYAGSTASEMAFLFYNSLDNKGYCPISIDCLSGTQDGWGLKNTGPFTNLNSDLLFQDYWSDEKYSPATGPYPIMAFTFDFGHGSQNVYPTHWVNDGHNSFYSWAVRNGDVTPTINPSPISQPSTLALMLAGLLQLGFYMGKANQ